MHLRVTVEHHLSDGSKAFLRELVEGLSTAFDFAPLVEQLNSIEGRLTEMTQATDDLAREVQETRDAVTALTGRYQAKIDTMQTHIDALQAALDAGDTAAAQAAADALDQLQTDMAAMGADPAPAPAPDAPSA